MKKSVYSIVLMDDVVEAVDALAYRLNTSRSNLINQILAEKVALITPEMQMKNVFDQVEKLLDGYSHFQIQPQAADCMMSIRSVLRYKYNPTIRYAITLDRSNNKRIGELKIISRTQSDVLQRYLSHFFELWSMYESQVQLPGWKIDQGGKWTRELIRQDEGRHDGEAVANAIADYIKAIDKGIKIYFEYNDNLSYLNNELSNHYGQYINSSIIRV
ncbi:hypothetical protein PBV87_04385 [Niameybacter massiliensis]|uniref:Ribbon-helix-helix protein CopG domain-containing protein n=1 Tax=Holtiella tumoricola TaxID=3018743 RepID=A0AA42DL88_9FIRM|nr:MULTISPECIES: hypothetical protein [Lachnospirales]MDA3730738.1 hypothetical protein [Holtiella tumoricola]